MKKTLLFCYINGRPIEPLKGLMKVFNEIYRRFNSNCKYFFVLNLLLESEYLDINLSPDKREIFIKDERSFYKIIKEKLT